MTPDSVQSGLALIFDMDGVIVNSNPMHTEAWSRFNRRYGIETTDAMIQRMYGRRGYIPDGRAACQGQRLLSKGMQVSMDHDLIIWLTKDLTS